MKFHQLFTDKTKLLCVLLFLIITVTICASAGDHIVNI